MAVVSGHNPEDKYTDLKLASFDDYIRYVRESASRMTPDGSFE